MTGARARGTLVALAAALLVGLVAPVIGVVEPAAVRGAATDLTLVTDAVYTVDPEAGHVGISMAVAVKNHTTETRTRRFWFDHAFLAVQPGAVSPRIGGLKGAQVRVSRRDAKSTLLRIDFGARLYSGRTATFRLGFDLPGRGKAASPQVRVGTSLITIPVWAYASSGARGSTVTVNMPVGWEVAVESGELARRTTRDGATVLESGSLANPLTFFAYVSAQQPAVYVDRPLTVVVGEQEVALLLKAWEDDATWTARTGKLFGDALPVLRRDIGLAWPMTGPLIVAESASRDAGAYAGLFDPGEGRMDVAYWAGPDVMIHQAAHAWFNGSLLADRWADEGFATFYALRAAAAMKLKVAPPKLTDKVAAAAVPLNAWTRAEAPGSAVDTYGYAASLALAKAVADAVGEDALAAAWADARDRVGAYQPPATPGSRAGAAVADPPETLADAPDWRGLLDILEARSGRDLSDLWRQWVVRPTEARLLEARADARASYARTLALAGAWRLPRSVRDALRAWDFAKAEALMADARSVIAQRNALAGMAERDGVRLTDAMRTRFESGAMTDASAQAAAERVALVAIEEAAAARSAEDDILSRIGMLGEHPEQSLLEARALVAQGDLEGSAAASARALRAWTVAWQEGRRRALLALAVLATVLVLVTAAAGSLRRARRHGRRPAMAHAAAGKTAHRPTSLPRTEGPTPGVAGRAAVATGAARGAATTGPGPGAARPLATAHAAGGTAPRAAGAAPPASGVPAPRAASPVTPPRSFEPASSPASPGPGPGATVPRTAWPGDA